MLTKPWLRHYILPLELPLLDEFAGDHHLKVKRSTHAGRTREMDCDDSPGKENYYSEETWLVQPGIFDKIQRIIYVQWKSRYILSNSQA